MIIQNKKVSDIYTGSLIFSTKEIDGIPRYTFFKVLEILEPEVESQFITVRGFEIIDNPEKTETKLILKKDSDIVLAYNSRPLAFSLLIGGAILGFLITLIGYMAVTKYLY